MGDREFCSLALSLQILYNLISQKVYFNPRMITGVGRILKIFHQLFDILQLMTI